MPQSTKIPDQIPEHIPDHFGWAPKSETWFDSSRISPQTGAGPS